MSPTNSIKALAAFVFVAGGVASALLTLLLGGFITLDLPSRHESMLMLLVPPLLVSLCPAPLFWGTVLSLFKNCQRLGTKLTLAGSILLTLYLELDYATHSIQDVGPPWLWLLPILVFTVDAAAVWMYRLHRLKNTPVP